MFVAHPMLACTREGLGPAPRCHCQHAHSRARRTGSSRRQCQRFCLATIRWTTQRWRGRAHRIEPLRECSTEAYASEPCECSQCGVKACSDCVRWSPLKCKACRSPQSMSITEASALQVAIAASLSGASVDSAANEPPANPLFFAVMQ